MHRNSLIFIYLVLFVEFPAGDSAKTVHPSYFYENKNDTIPNECKVVLQKFAGSASNLTLCAIQNARPIHVCKNCVFEYTAFRDNYATALNQVVNSTSNGTTTCRSILVSKDNLEVVLTFYGNIQDLWEGANCDVCFDWVNDVPTLSNNTVHFYELFDATMNCLNNGISNESEKICERCMKDYLALNEYYETLSGNSIDLEKVCMDIVDSMNTTRSTWSGSLNCCQLRKHPEVIFLCCTGVISSLPILFYVVLRYFGQMRDLPRALKQTRFKQTFLAALQSRRQSSA